MRERAPQKHYKPIVSGLKIHLHTYKQCSSLLLKYGMALYTTVLQNTNTEKNLWICERNIYIFRSQITSAYIYNQCSSLLLLMVRRYIYRVSQKKLTLLNILPNKKCETFFGKFLYVWMAEGLIYHMTPK